MSTPSTALVPASPALAPAPHTPDPVTALVRDHYDRTAASYARLSRIGDTLLGVDRLRRRVLAHARGDVLEVAIGAGACLPHYPRDARITGVDVSAEMLGFARARADQLGRAVELRTGDAARLDVADGRFDTVVSSLSLCTFADPVATLREMARVCRPDGRLLFVEHGRASARWLARMQARRADRHFAKHRCHLDRDPLALVEAAGLTVERVERRLLGVLSGIVARPPR